jgi:hypothetical protein
MFIHGLAVYSPKVNKGVVERVGVEEEEQGVAVGVAALPPSAAAALLA